MSGRFLTAIVDVEHTSSVPSVFQSFNLSPTKMEPSLTRSLINAKHTNLVPCRLNIRDFRKIKQHVYGKRQTAEMTT